MPTTQDVTLLLGDTWTLICTCHDANNNILAVDSAEWRIASTQSLEYLGTVGTNNIFIANGGVVTVIVPPSDQATANIQPGSYTHELFITGNTAVGSIQVTGKAYVQDSLKHKYP